ncbi:MAG: hypothetical protein PXY39_06290, partial [archaeon]|nr:hypothetical protein [archaeon]
MTNEEGQGQQLRPEQLAVPFKDGIIGRWEEFLTKENKATPMWARGCGTAIVSADLYDIALADKMDDELRPNLFIVNIGPSGRG